MSVGGLEGTAAATTAPSAETLPSFQRVPLDHEDVTSVRDAITHLSGFEPRIVRAVVSFLGDGQLETLHSHADHYFAVCRTPIRGQALDADGRPIKTIEFAAGDVIAFDPLPANQPHRLRLSTGEAQAAITYVPYTLPSGANYPQPGLYKPAAAAK